MERYDTRIPNKTSNYQNAILQIDIGKWVQHASRTLAFESHLLLLDVLEVDVLEILWQLILYAMIDKLETSKRTK
jgi:hypothetical protein